MKTIAKVPLIHNPAAGSGRWTARLSEAEALLGAKGIETYVVATDRPGHATELARGLAAQGHGTLLVLGGDGTVSEVANGILDLPERDRPVLGLLPAGTGNDFLRDFGVFDLKGAVKSIASGRATAVDVVDVAWPGGRRFVINVLGTGIMAKAGDRRNRQFKWLGRRGYDVAALVELTRMKASPTRMALDGNERDGDYPLVAVCNSVHTGGGMKMAPAADPTDALLDVLVVECATRTELLMLLLTKVRKGLHIEHPKVRIERAATVRIQPEDPSPLLLDGEVTGTTPVELKVLPGALGLLAETG